MSKYQIGMYFQDQETPDTFYRILAVSPSVDHKGGYVYFVEVVSHGADIGYKVVSEKALKELIVVDRKKKIVRLQTVDGKVVLDENDKAQVKWFEEFKR